MRPTVVVAAACASICLATAWGTAASAGAAERPYTVVVTADWTKTVTDATGSLDARSTGRLRYSTRVSVGWNARRDTVEVTAWPGSSARGTYAVRLGGTDARGCSFDYSKELGGPMDFRATARVATGSFRMPTKQVRAPYFLEARIYPLGITPTLPPTCDSLRAPVADGALLGLVDLFQRVVWFDDAQKNLVGTWPEFWNYRPFPFGAVGYVRLWASAPRKQGGVFQHPAPVATLMAGKPLTLGASLAGTRQVAGAPSVTVTTVGRISFTFKRRG
jgi:hypothetical protein